MKTRIRKNNYRRFKLMDIICKAILRGRNGNVCSAKKVKPVRSTRNEETTKIPENPAAYYPLGWRKDA